MADILKAGARKPRILGGGCYTGNNYLNDETARERGVMPGMGYDLTVTNADAAYTARLTEPEMLRTIHEWLGRMNLHHDQLRRSAEKRALTATADKVRA